MIFHWEHRVLPTEVDWLGHASNVAFVDWLQSAAIAHSSSLGWTPERYLQYGSAFMVRSHNVTYLGQAKEGDDLVVRTWVEDVSSARSLRRYELSKRGAQSQLISRGQTIWAFVDLKRGVPRRIPGEILSAFPIRSRMPAEETNNLPIEKSPWTLSEW